MTELTERTIVQSIKLSPETGRIEIERILQVLRGDEVIAATVSGVVLEAGQDLSALALEPIVLAVAAAVWTPDQIEGAADAMVAAMTVRREKLEDDGQKIAARLAELREETEQAAAGLQRSREAIAAAHLELDAEHATLAERSENITAARTALFAQAETLRTKRPQLDVMLTQLAADLAVHDDALSRSRQ